MAFTNTGDSLRVPSMALDSDPHVDISTDDPLMRAFADAGITFYYGLGKGFVIAVDGDGSNAGIFRIVAGPEGATFPERDEFLHAEYDADSPILDYLVLSAGNRIGAPNRPQIEFMFDNPGGSSEGILSLLADSIRLGGAGISFDAPITGVMNGTVPGKFLVETVRTTAIGQPTGFTAETTLDSVTFAAKAGQRYRAVWEGSVQSSVAGDDIGVTMKYNPGAVNVVDKRQVCAFAGHGTTMHIERSFIPIPFGSGDANITVSVTGRRLSGTGLVTAYGAAENDVTLQIYYA